jgi:hypothetical protein
MKALMMIMFLGLLSFASWGQTPADSTGNSKIMNNPPQIHYVPKREVIQPVNPVQKRKPFPRYRGNEKIETV